MFKKKGMSILLSALIVIGSLGISQSIVKANGINGWQLNGPTWNYYINGVRAKGWVLSNGKWYYLYNEDGQMAAAKWIDYNGKYYYLNPNGDMATGWIFTGGHWYYSNSSGARVTNSWIGNYYLSLDGTMLTSATTPDGYYVDANGKWDGKAPVIYTNSRQNPANLGEKMYVTTTTYDKKVFNSEITVESIIRGNDAWNLIYNENMFNNPPKDGYEYILARISFKLTKASNINNQVNLSGFDFKLVSSSGKDYDYASVVMPKPSLEASLYEGASSEGYVAFMVAKDDSKPLIVYDKAYNGTGGVWFKGYNDTSSQTSNTTYFPQMSDVPMPTNVSYYKSSTLDGSVFYYYSPSSIPKNFVTSYGSLLNNNGWLFYKSGLISGDLASYYIKGQRVVIITTIGNDTVICGSIH